MNRQRCTTCYYHLLLSVAIISGILGTAVPPVLSQKIRWRVAGAAAIRLKRNAMPNRPCSQKYKRKQPQARHEGEMESDACRRNHQAQGTGEEPERSNSDGQYC